ncbi:MAG: tetratricopeptide repeat protein [Saprospiraceae bacterium]|nr:tetratricopeptide repeat protein [Saprospiraceae bacterium]
MRVLIIALVSLISFAVQGQNARLAQQYFMDGEFEKASILYKQLYIQNNDNEYYFDRYFNCLINLESYEEAQVLVERQIRRSPSNIRLYVSLGKLYESQFLDDKANQQYQLAISRLPRNKYEITKLANIFTVDMNYDLAIQTFEKGATLLRDDKVFAYNLGELYRRKAESQKMVEQYLNALAYNPERMNTIQTICQRYFSQEEFDELKKQLYTRIQEDREVMYYPVLLTWVFIQEKEYSKALRQVLAMDRRLKENGQRIYQLAQIAANDKDYDTAIRGYEYIVDQKGISSSFYIDAKREALRNRRIKLVEGYDYTQEDLIKLKQLYLDFLDEFGRRKVTAPIILELSELEALYLNDLDEAISLLEKMIDYPGLNPWVQAQGKLQLGDYYLIQGEVWESTLLYSQVDKSFKDDQLGHEARYRNARLSYFNRNFQWAQSQFDVLKASTSKLIANDALDLSVFIMDHLGLDSTENAMGLYADADLLVFQNRFDEAFNKLDTLVSSYPQHTLKDDVLYLKATIFQKRKDYIQAAEMLQEIVDKHVDGIRADNALYQLGQLYEQHLNDTEQAKIYYEKLFIEFSDSTYAVEARKRYRTLRGDDIQ